MEERSSDSPAFSLRYRATADDAFRQAQLTTGKRGSWLDVAVKVLLPLLVCGVVLVIIGLPDQEPSPLVISLIGLFVVVWSASGFLMLYLPWRPAEAKRRWVADETTADFYPEGIRSTSDYRSLSVRWEAITEMRENSHVVVFLRRGLVVGWLPSSAFSNGNQREQVLAFARAQMAAHPAMIDGVPVPIARLVL